MSEEVWKAIETLKEVASDDFDTLGDDISPKMAQNILNLIENQQKEIEEKNKDIKKLNDLLMLSELDYISKDKIRKKIKEIDKEYIEIQERQIEMSTFMKIAEKRKNKKDILEELLEEN